MSAPAALGGISYRHGSWHPVEDLTERGLASSDEVAALRRGGLERYSVIRDAPRLLYPETVAESLERTGTAPGDVGAVLFLSSTASAYDDHADMIELCRSLGMTGALPISLSLAQCTNFSYGLMTARALMDSEDLRSVLVVGADVLDENRGSRLLPGAAAVFSDTVVSCVVARDLDEGYAIEHGRHLVDAELSALDPQKDLLAFIERFANRLEELCAGTYAATGRGPDDFSHLVLANLSLPVLKNYAAAARMPFSRVRTDNVARFGHCFAYDQLITLDALGASGSIRPGDVALVLGIGANYLFSSTTCRRL